MTTERPVETVNVKRPFGKSVRAWRNQLGISQEALAERAGLHRTYICDVERGARNVSLESIEKLARALEVSVPSLLSYSRDPSSDSYTRQPLPGMGMVDILFVEDLQEDIDLTLHALEEARITNRIHVVRDGVEALDYLFCTGDYSHRGAQDHPQLILLDLGLPKVSGLEVLRRVKADPRTSRIPVVVLTASGRDQDLMVSKRLGADAYIVKPVGIQNLSVVTPGLFISWAMVRPNAGLHETGLAIPRNGDAGKMASAGV